MTTSCTTCNRLKRAETHWNNKAEDGIGLNDVANWIWTGIRRLFLSVSHRKKAFCSGRSVHNYTNSSQKSKHPTQKVVLLDFKESTYPNQPFHIVQFKYVLRYSKHSFGAWHEREIWNSSIKLGQLWLRCEQFRKENNKSISSLYSLFLCCVLTVCKNSFFGGDKVSYRTGCSEFQTAVYIGKMTRWGICYTCCIEWSKPRAERSHTHHTH